jgi:TonB family protein
MIARRDKKCFLAATLVHAALVVVLLVGPGFLSSKPPALPLLDYIPDELVDAALNRSGAPGVAARPAPEPPAPEPPKAEVAPPPPTPPKAVKAPAPEPEPEPLKPLPKANSFTVPETKKAPPKTPPKTEAKSTPTKSSPKINTKLVTRNDSSAAKQREAERKQREQATKEWQNKLNETGKSLRENLSDSITVETPGRDGSGPSVGNWAQVVHSIYDRAWIEPSSASDARAAAKATITIARDGAVVSASLTSPSGNAALDQSVRAVLDRVRQLPAFPAGAREERRTVIINFKLLANRLPG